MLSVARAPPVLTTGVHTTAEAGTSSSASEGSGGLTVLSKLLFLMFFFLLCGSVCLVWGLWGGVVGVSKSQVGSGFGRWSDFERWDELSLRDLHHGA